MYAPTFSARQRAAHRPLTLHWAWWYINCQKTIRLSPPARQFQNLRRKSHFGICQETRSPSAPVSTQCWASTSWNVAVQPRAEMDGVKGHIWSSLSFSQANVSIGRTQKRPEPEASRRPPRPLIHRRSGRLLVYMCAVELKPLIKSPALKRLYMRRDVFPLLRRPWIIHPVTHREEKKAIGRVTYVGLCRGWSEVGPGGVEPSCHMFTDSGVWPWKGFLLFFTITNAQQFGHFFLLPTRRRDVAIISDSLLVNHSAGDDGSDPWASSAATAICWHLNPPSSRLQLTLWERTKTLRKLWFDCRTASNSPGRPRRTTHVSCTNEFLRILRWRCRSCGDYSFLFFYDLHKPLRFVFPKPFCVPVNVWKIYCYNYAYWK